MYKLTNQKAVISNDLQKKLLSIGKKHYLKEGAKNLSIRKISKEAKVNLGSFVYHFKNKDAFIEKIFQDLYQEFLVKFYLEFEKTEQFDSYSEQLRFIILKLADLALDSSNILARFLIDTLQGDFTAIKSFNSNPPVHAIKIIELIKKGQAANEFSKQMNPKQIFVFCMTSTLAPYVLLSHFSKSSNSILKNSLSDLISKKFLEIRIDLILLSIRQKNIKRKNK